MSKRSEEKMRLLAAIIDSAADAIVSIDSRSFVTSWNIGAERMFGYKPEEMLGRSLSRLTPAASVAEDAARFASVARGTPFEHFETERVHKEGQLIPVSLTASPIRDESGRIVGVSLIARDISDREAVDASLRQGRDTLRRLIEQAPVSIAMFDRAMRYVAVSEHWKKEIARTADNLIGQSHYEVHPDLPDRWRLIHERALRGEVIRAEADEWMREDGSKQWLRWAVEPWTDAGGHIAGIIIYTEDITERHKAEKMVRETEARFHQMFDHMQEGCQIIGFDLRFLYLNQSVERHTRQARQALLGRSMLETFPNFHRTPLYHAVKGCLEDRIPRNLEYPVRYPEGEVWFDFSIQPCADGVFMLSTDVTERQRALERFRDLAESLPQLVWTCDAQGKREYLSRQWEEYTGLKGADLHTHWLEYIHPEDHAPLQAAWWAAVRFGTLFHFEYRVKRHDGMYRWFAARATPKRDTQGHITRWYGVSTDIEDEKRSRERLMRNQKMEALGTLAGGIAHDFNNILLAITGNTGLALEDTAHDSPARQSLLDIEQASRRAADLVRRILAFSRREETQREVLSLQPVLEEALKLLRATVGAQIELRVHFAPDTPRTVCDATQVHQILINLVTNAAYAIGDRPGLIEIRLEPATVDAERVNGEIKPGLYARLCVADDGCGMDSQTISRIFDPFFTTKPAGRGTGLGLSVVDGIMKAHGGTVTVYSEINKGTAFRLYFPATQDFAKTIVNKEQPIPIASGQRVFYIDDDELLVSLMRRKLTRLGYEVEGEQDPLTALARFRSNPAAFDVVITDLSMPGMRGFELARELLAIRPGLPIIVTSGFLQPEDQETARTIGVSEVVLKPGTSDNLGAILDQLLKGKQT